MQSIFENDWAAFVAGFDRSDTRKLSKIRWEFLSKQYKCNYITINKTLHYVQEKGCHLTDIFEYIDVSIGELGYTFLTPFFVDSIRHTRGDNKILHRRGKYKTTSPPGTWKYNQETHENLLAFGKFIHMCIIFKAYHYFTLDMFEKLRG